MNPRRIQTITIVDKQHINIAGTIINVDDSVTRYMNGNSFKIARRPFSGSERIRFFREFDGGIHDDFETLFQDEEQYESTGSEGYMWLCRAMCYELLGVGERTKSFSLWVKQITNH